MTEAEDYIIRSSEQGRALREMVRMKQGDNKRNLRTLLLRAVMHRHERRIERDLDLEVLSNAH